MHFPHIPIPHFNFSKLFHKAELTQIILIIVLFLLLFFLVKPLIGM